MDLKSHISHVRILYKAILRLHRGMPGELRALGDQYVRDEFKRHKTAEPEFVPVFMKEWTNYALTMSKQMGRKSGYDRFGVKLSEEDLSKFSEEQIGQLFELYEEMQKPTNPENPLGFNPLVENKR